MELYGISIQFTLGIWTNSTSEVYILLRIRTVETFWQKKCGTKLIEWKRRRNLLKDSFDKLQSEKSSGRMWKPQTLSTAMSTKRKNSSLITRNDKKTTFCKRKRFVQANKGDVKTRYQPEWTSKNVKTLSTLEHGNKSFGWTIFFLTSLNIGGSWISKKRKKFAKTFWIELARGGIQKLLRCKDVSYVARQMQTMVKLGLAGTHH